MTFSNRKVSSQMTIGESHTPIVSQHTRKISGLNNTWKLNIDEKDLSFDAIQQESSKLSESSSSRKSNAEIKLKISQEFKQSK